MARVGGPGAGAVISRALGPGHAGAVVALVVVGAPALAVGL